MKEIIKTLPMMLALAATVPALGQSDVEPSAASDVQNCQLPTAETREERKTDLLIQTIANQMADDLSERAEELFVKPSNDARQTLLESLQNIPEAERDENTNNLIAELNDDSLVLSQRDAAGIIEKVKCSIIDKAEVLRGPINEAIKEAARVGEPRIAAGVSFNFFGIDLGATIGLLKIANKVKLGAGAELSIGFFQGIGVDEDGRGHYPREYATGFVGMGPSVSGASEKFINPRLVLPFNNLRVFLSPKPKTEIPDFYGWYGSLSLNTFDLGFVNFRGQAAIKNPLNENRVVMLGAGSSMGQQQSPAVVNGRGYFFSDLPTVLTRLGNL